MNVHQIRSYTCTKNQMQQELSYRKQIARQLRPQYAEGIYDNPVTLISRLTVTQGHWKWNHWVDHIRLTIRRVIGRWIISWPWNVGQRSFKVIEITAIRKLGCAFLFAFCSNYGRICSRLWDIQCQRMAWPWKPGYGSFKVIENGAIRWTICDFLVVGHCKYSFILCHFRVIWR